MLCVLIHNTARTQNNIRIDPVASHTYGEVYIIYTYIFTYKKKREREREGEKEREREHYRRFREI